MSANLLDKGYEPQNVENRWYAFWQEKQLFAAKEKSDQAAYSIVIPPPNVTGVLHMGHALNNTLQDILCRYMRLKNKNVLWMPGTDHAGIATQNVVERQLAEKGVTRHQIGREQFIEEVWQWKEKSGNAIINQLKRLGASCDWGRERFTMDEGLSAAVREVFVTLYEQGLIYRDNYIINWCPRCRTALADLEVEHEDLDGTLYHIHYPASDGSDGLIVATTRPETLFGDTAVAINPEDDRYQTIAFDAVKLPLTDRIIPVIKDTYVDTTFGTGALKVTPAHDPNDFEIGKRHNLERPKVIDDDGIMTEGAGKYKGLDRFECRKVAVKDLKALGVLLKTIPYQHGVGHCYRCKTVVEPNLSKQWFVKTKPLAEKAIAAVENGETRIIPTSWRKTYFDWMYNIKDWCISRQIWWGHQIPAWSCKACGHMTVARQTPDQCASCNGTDLVQESDVLDTWFSSALWPFSTMGWPERTELLNMFYPTSTLITGFDILFFWIARMMMMGLHFMGKVPFKDVYVHALVRDENGQKMSKSKGNVIDPLTVIENYGTDAFRFTLAAFAAQGRDIKLSEKRVEGYRHFINKLWNAARFSLMHIDKPYDRIDTDHMTLADRWILSRLCRVTQKAAEALEDYRFNEAASALYQFVWHEFCDWYLEAAKPTLYGRLGEEQAEGTKRVLWRVLHDTLILLHPFTPYVTEEIYHKLPGTEGSIMTTAYPSETTVMSAISPDDTAEQKMTLLMDVINGIRNIRGEMNIAPSMTLSVMLQTEEQNEQATLKEHADLMCHLARLDSVEITTPGDKPPSSATAITGQVTIFVSLENVIDFSQEKQRLEKEIAKLTSELTGISKKLNNDGFLSKAPQDVVQKVKQRYAELIEKQDKLQANLEKIITAEKG